MQKNNLNSNIFKNIKIIFKNSFSKNNKKTLYLVILLSIVITIFEVSIIQLTYATTSIFNQANLDINNFKIYDSFKNPKLSAFFLLFLSPILFLLRVNTQKKSLLLAARLGNSITSRITGKAITGSKEFHEKNSNSFLINRIELAIQLIPGLFQPTLTSIVNSFSSLGILIGIIYINPKITILILLFITLFYLIFAFNSKKSINTINKKSEGLLEEITRLKVQSIKAWRKNVIDGDSKDILKKLNRSEKEYRSFRAIAKVESLKPRFGIESFIYSILAILCIYITITNNNSFNSAISYGLTLGAAGVRIFPMIQNIYDSLIVINSNKFAIDSCAKAIREYCPNENKENLEKTNNKKDSSIGFLKIKKASIKLNKNLNLIIPDITIKRGDFVVIKGISGVGKSSLMDIILGLSSQSKDIIDYQSILGKKRDIYSEEARKQISITEQENVFYQDNINNFFKISIPTASKINYEKFKKILNFLKIEDLYKRLAMESKKTTIENKSILDSISGGQKQRIAIAKALLKKASIYLFDEPTSAIDQELSEKIIMNLKILLKNKITIVISHDPESIKYATKVLELKLNNKNQTIVKYVQIN